MSNRFLTPKPNRDAVTDFLKKVSTMPSIKPASKKGRLIFALDATASRQPTWDKACHIQAQMFETTVSLGGLEIQLCFYRGFEEFFASHWISQPEELLKTMNSVSCLGGYTQIGKLLQHARDESRNRKIDALVFIGDSMEENPTNLKHLAGELGILNIPVFLFQEGRDQIAEQAFRQIAKVTNGAYCHFDPNSAKQLHDLLNAVAVYAAGGVQALDKFIQHQGGVTLQLTHQMKRD